MKAPQYDSAFSRSLNRILNDSTFTAAELAEVADCSPRHIYHVRNGVANMDLAKAEAIARYCSERGELRLSRCFVHDTLDFVAPTYCAPDGSIDDDVTALVVAAGVVAENHHHGRTDPEAMKMLRRAVERMQAEVNLTDAKNAA